MAAVLCNSRRDVARPHGHFRVVIKKKNMKKRKKNSRLSQGSGLFSGAASFILLLSLTGCGIILRGGI